MHFSNSVKITQMNVIFSYFIKFYEHWVISQSLYDTKKSSIEKTMKLVLGKVVMSNKQMLDRQIN